MYLLDSCLIIVGLCVCVCFFLLQWFTGNLTERHREIFLRNPLYVGMKLPEVKEVEPFDKRFHKVSSAAIDVMKVCFIYWTIVVP